MALRVSFQTGLALFGFALCILLVVLDKGGKLKGPILLVLLGVAATLIVPLAVGNPWVTDAPSGMASFSRGLLLVLLIGIAYSLMAVWISPGGFFEVAHNTSGATFSPAPIPPKPTITLPAPIEVSFTCSPDEIPITVPAGREVYILALNNTQYLTFKIHNIGGTKPIVWPYAAWMVEEARVKHDAGLTIYRCDIGNHGQSDLLELTLPFKAQFGSYTPKRRSYPTPLLISVLPKAGTVSLYIVNNCPVEALSFIGRAATARPIEEASARKFDLIMDNPHTKSESWGLGPSGFTWTQNACEESNSLK